MTTTPPPSPTLSPKNISVSQSDNPNNPDEGKVFEDAKVKNVTEDGPSTSSPTEKQEKKPSNSSDDELKKAGEAVGAVVVSGLKGLKWAGRGAYSAMKTAGKNVVAGVEALHEKRLDAEHRRAVKKEEKRREKQSQEDKRAEHEWREGAKQAEHEREEDKKDRDVERERRKLEAQQENDTEIVKQKMLFAHESERDRRRNDEEEAKRNQEMQAMRLEKNTELTSKDMDIRKHKSDQDHERAMKAMDVEEEKSKRLHDLESQRIQALKEVMIAGMQAGALQISPAQVLGALTQPSSSSGASSTPTPHQRQALSFTPQPPSTSSGSQLRELDESDEESSPPVMSAKAKKFLGVDQDGPKRGDKSDKK